MDKKINIFPTIRRIAIIAAFSILACGVAIKPVLADEHHHHHEEHEWHHHHDYHHHYGEYAYVPAPNYYYPSSPNYYYTPEPDQYYYNTPPGYAPPPPSQGINLFFGIH